MKVTADQCVRKLKYCGLSTPASNLAPMLNTSSRASVRAAAEIGRYMP